MSFLLDSNILVRLSQVENPQHYTANDAIRFLHSSSENLFIAPQNIIEFWSVATRPVENNGLGLNIAETKNEISKYKQLFVLVDDTPHIFRQWERLVDRYNVSGKNVHDVRLVAAMLEHNITHLLTFNIKDFKRFSEIKVVDPASVV